MTNSFYNTEENYEIPSTSGYFKFEEGENVFRILGAFSEKKAIQGIEYWTTIEGKRKPVRLAKKADGTFPVVPVDQLETNKFGDLDVPKYFWALPVWDYQEKKVKILEITQKKIIKYIQTMIANPKWGDPREYDLIITKEKSNGKVEYTCSCNPKESLSQEIIEAYGQTPINIQALFTGDNPFEKEE